MKKFLSILLLCVILVSLTACGNTDQKLTMAYGNNKIIIKCNKDFILRQGIFTSDAVQFSIFDTNKENFAVGYLVGLEFFDEFKTMIAEDKTVTVYETSDTLLYYSCINDEDNTLTEYDRIIKIDDVCIMILAGIDKDKVDSFYSSLEITHK